MARFVIFSAIIMSFSLVSCKEDCGQLTWFIDEDGDGYGNSADSLLLVGCNRPEGYVLDNTDCNDQDERKHPNAVESPDDGIDTNCKVEIWDGPLLTFTKEANADWTLAENQDIITANIIFTRQNRKQLYNYQYWQEAFAQDVSENDLTAEFWNNSTILDFVPTGGTKGVRWAILDDTGADNPWDTSFNLYGNLGDTTNFYSFHNIASMIAALNDGVNVDSVMDDFTIYEGGNPRSNTVMIELIDKNLGIWLVEENSYMTFTFTNWGQGNGGAISYMRSTPPENN